MVSKPHRNNSDFQLRYFLAGSCKTADGAWLLLYGQKIDIEVKVKHAVSQRLQREANIAEAEEVLSDPDATKAAVLRAQATIIENEAGEDIWRLNTEAAKAELATITALMDELEPLRVYGHLPILEAGEACQRQEWLLELQEQAENFLVSQGTIPHDYLATMRSHPDFKRLLVPHIQNTMNRLGATESVSDRLLALNDIRMLT